MIIDPRTPIGKVRLRVGDFLELEIMPDAVYQSTLDDLSGNIPRAAQLIAQYILATLTAQTHQKLAQLEIYGEQWFSNYLAFVKATILNPNLMTTAPIPYGASLDSVHPILQFQSDWNLNYASGTQSQALSVTAIGGDQSTAPGWY